MKKLHDYKLTGTDGVHTEETVIYNAERRMKELAPRMEWNPDTITVKLVDKQAMPKPVLENPTPEQQEKLDAMPNKTNYIFEVYGDMAESWKKEEARRKAINRMWDDIEKEEGDEA